MLRMFAIVLLAATAVAQDNFPPPVSPTSNPQTPAKVLLGMALFFEEQLSSTSTVACATCHDFATGGADPRTRESLDPGPDGVFGTGDDRHGSPGIVSIAADGLAMPSASHGFAANITLRRSPTVLNTGYHPRLGYDGSKTSLEQLIAVPPVHTVEMAQAGRTWTDVCNKIAAARPLVLAYNLPARLQLFVGGHSYPSLFQIAFGSTAVTQQRVVDAIACYLRTLNTDQSKWDLVQAGQAQLTPEEQLGLQLWSSPANGATSCKTCHGDFEARVQFEGPIVGQMTVALTGPYGAPVPTRLLFHNLGIRPIADDPGRQSVTGSSLDGGKFRVASLRNVELTGPYFHNGSAATLHDVVDYYDRGGDFHVNQASSLTSRGYAQFEKDALVALLRTLTDPRVAAGAPPFDRPVLGIGSTHHTMSFWDSETTASGSLVAEAPFAPLLGESRFQFTLTGVTPGVPAILLLDVSLGSEPLGYNVILSGTPAFQMHYAGLAQPMPGDAGGFARAPVPLPAVPELSGIIAFAQWAVLEPSSQWPVASSNVLYVPLL